MLFSLLFVFKFEDYLHQLLVLLLVPLDLVLQEVDFVAVGGALEVSHCLSFQTWVSASMQSHLPYGLQATNAIYHYWGQLNRVEYVS